MKKTFALLTAFTVLALSLASCATKPNAITETSQTDAVTETQTEEVTTAQTPATEEVTTEEVTTDAVTETETTPAVVENSIYKLYTEAESKNDALTDLDISILSLQDTSIEVQGQTIPAKSSTKIDLKIKDYKSDNVLLEEHMTENVASEEMGDQSYVFDIIVDKDNVYVRQGGEDGYTTYAKSSEEGQQLEQSFALPESGVSIRGYSEEAFDGAAAEQDEAGNTLITLSMNDALFNEAVNDIVSTTLDSFAAMGLSDIEYDITDTDIHIKISSDGYVVEYVTNFTLTVSMSVSGVSATATSVVKGTTTLNNPGQSVSIQTP